jgi:colanic acid/amylovoran biosynthesis glycosyltransferase
MRRTFLARSETWIYVELRHGHRYPRVVLTTRTENLDLFPWPRVFMPADLPRFSSAWWRDRLGRSLLAREPYFERVVRDEGVSLVHAHFAYDAVWALPLCRRTGLPLVTTFHGADVYNPNVVRSFRAAYAQLFARGARFLALGRRMLDRAVQIGCPCEKLRLVRLSVDVDEFAFSPRPPVRDRLVLLFCGRLIEVKGLRYVIEAMARLKAMGTPAELRVIGYADPPDQDYPALARDLGVSDCVAFLGYQPPAAVRRQMVQAHVFVQPSVTTANGIMEGAHPVTLIEAQATGCPVIATRHSDMPDAMCDGETGWLVDERQPEQIAERARWFWDRREDLDAFGRRAREYVVANHNAAVEGRNLEAIYDEVLGGLIAP